MQCALGSLCSFFPFRFPAVPGQRQFSRNVCGQAVVNNDFERLYWEGDPVDNYAKAIRRINKHACYVKDPGVFYFGRKEVSKTDLANAIMDSTDLSLQDWLFSIRRRQYDRDDFIPTLHPDACPKNVLNIFEGLAIQHKDCKEADVHDCESLLKSMKDSL